MNLFDELEVPEVIEFRRDTINLTRDVVEQRELNDETHAFYAFSAEICKTKGVALLQGGLIMLCVWVDSNRKVTVKVHIEAHAETVINETLVTCSRRQAVHGDFPSPHEFVLKICGRQEYLLGSFPIAQYKVKL